MAQTESAIWRALSKEFTVQAAFDGHHIILAKGVGRGITEAWGQMLVLSLTGGQLGKVTAPF